jgi:hypothetical protein
MSALKYGMREAEKISSLELYMREAKYHRHVGEMTGEEFAQLKAIFRSRMEELSKRPKR